MHRLRQVRGRLPLRSDLHGAKTAAAAAKAHGNGGRRDEGATALQVGAGGNCVRATRKAGGGHRKVQPHHGGGHHPRGGLYAASERQRKGVSRKTPEGADRRGLPPRGGRETSLFPEL